MLARTVFISLLFLVPIHLNAKEQASVSNEINTAEIEQLTGAKGKFDKKQEVFKVSVPRNDIDINVMGVNLIPSMGLTSWAAFMPIGKDVMVMGDLVLLENQVNPVMSVALENGLNVTALHNHFLGDSP